ncbi:oocyte zinc finger protein XlCOF22-like isoform X2 [Maniola hyperantus]|uniref:oocyte zinc finger protein XlCOF22-like isoform X2 n=1 Tax=Aphantopus hyperantus TaxID=2795564 RepID=UPI0015690D3E|nr:oocyte zinc finger protein XlCOF22-like isoform X2 [Maniola hyperantus]
MEGVLSDGMCRCCATEGSFKDFQVAYQWMGVEEIYGNMLKDCFDITLSVSEEISNGGICEVCITQLRNACNFKQQVQRTEEKFQKKLQEASFKTEGIKMEISRFEDDDSNISADDFSSPEYEVPIKVEKVEEKPKKRAAAKASTSKAKKTKASEGEPSVKRVRHQLLIKSEIPEDVKKSIKTEKNDEPQENKEFSENNDSTLPVPVLRNKTIAQRIPTNTLLTGLPNRKKKPRPVTEKKKHYNNFEVILANSTATPIRSHDGINYKCCFCTNQYNYPAELKAHTLMVHDSSDDRRQFMKKQCTFDYILKLDITQLKCKVCDEDIDTIDRLLDHLQDMHQKLIYMDMKTQIVPFKFGEEELKCVVCSLAFSKFKVLLEHMHTHFRNYVCEICDYGCISRSRMYHHKETHDIGSFACSKCDKVFETRPSLRKHMNMIHIFMNMPYKCAICNERFKHGPVKDTHMVTVHGIPPVIRKCKACDKTFTTRKWLHLHTKRFHLMEKLFPCAECGMNFSTRAHLKKHVLIKHTGKREFQCDVCLKRFTTNKILKDHTKRVHMKQLIPCNECDTSCPSEAQLNKHMLLKHSGKKVFQCDICTKWFTSNKIMKQHVKRIHMRHRRFTCARCGRDFVQRRSFHNHLRTVHGEIGEIDDEVMSTT